MKKLVLLLFVLLSPSIAYAWPSETGGGVVSNYTSFVATSIETTQVLQSDLLTLLYGETRFGGAANYSSFDTGGVLSFKNVASSANKIVLNDGDTLLFGVVPVSVDTVTQSNGYVMNALHTPKINTSEISADILTVGTAYITSFGKPFSALSVDSLQINGKLAVSGDSVLNALTATVTTATSTVSDTFTANTANILTNKVTDTVASGNTTLAGRILFNKNGALEYNGAKPKRTIILTGGGATPNTASQSADTAGLGGTSALFKTNRLVYSPFAVNDAYWSFVVPNSFTGTSVDTQVVWYSSDIDNGTVSFDTQTAKLADNTAFTATSFGAYGSVQDTYTASGNTMITASYKTPVSWTSGDIAYVRLQKNSTDAGDTVSHDVNIVAVVVKYEAQTDSD
jgi:hypothetical protein